MKYKGIRNFQHGQTERIGILITNLGTRMPQPPPP